MFNRVSVPEFCYVYTGSTILRPPTTGRTQNPERPDFGSTVVTVQGKTSEISSCTKEEQKSKTPGDVRNRVPGEPRNFDRSNPTQEECRVVGLDEGDSGEEEVETEERTGEKVKIPRNTNVTLTGPLHLIRRLKFQSANR